MCSPTNHGSEPADLPKLEAVLAEADRTGVVAFDIMTERFEIATMLQRALVNDAAVFGEIVKGTEDEPGVYMESVHHLMKVVSGAPNIRPAWFFDAAEQGEGLNDIGTHLVDLVQWTLFPEEVIDHRADLQRRRRATVADRDSRRRISARHRHGRHPFEPPAPVKNDKPRLLRQHPRVVHGTWRTHKVERDLGLGSAPGRRRHALCLLPRHARAHRGPPDAADGY